MSKWEKFHTQYSPVEIDKPNMAGGNLELDWQRESCQDRMLINGLPLATYAKNYNNFSQKEDVLRFFEEVLLKDMQSVSNSQKTEIINYLEKTFHQGGFMYPVSAPFSVAMQEYNADLDIYDKYATVGDMDMRFNIQTTPNGFKVQEITGVKFLLGTPDTSGEKMADENFRINPDVGNDYVVKLEGTVDIDFSKNTSSPTVTVESNSISYGSKAMQERLDKRGLGQMIVDFFKNIFGLNKVQDLSDKFAEKNKQTLNENTEKSEQSVVFSKSI